MNRYELAESRRQAALDYIIANPGAKAPQIIAALEWHPVSGSDRLSDMTDKGELSRVPASCRAAKLGGFTQMVKTYAYTALVTKTRSAANTTKDIRENLTPAAKRRPLEVVREFRDPNRRPIPNQGGQGAVRHEIRRGCSLS